MYTHSKDSYKETNFKAYTLSAIARRLELYIQNEYLDCLEIDICIFKPIGPAQVKQGTSEGTLEVIKIGGIKRKIVNCKNPGKTLIREHMINRLFTLQLNQTSNCWVLDLSSSRLSA